jgi:hypothetical protein
MAITRIFLYGVKVLVLVTETRCVICEVKTTKCIEKVPSWQANSSSATLNFPDFIEDGHPLLCVEIKSSF